MPRQASALPWLFILSCRKIFRFGVLRSFEGKIFSHKNIQRTKKYWMYFKDDGFIVGKKILSKPCKSLCESALRVPLLFGSKRKGVEPIYVQMSGGHLLPPVQTLVATIIFATGENASRLPYPSCFFSPYRAENANRLPYPFCCTISFHRKVVKPPLY